jgi:hypothetical protein
LDELSQPPERLTEDMIQEYADCLMGRGYSSQWASPVSTVNLNFGRPSVRISGGEFYTWPHVIRDRRIPENERLNYQTQLLHSIRTTLPEHDIYILTNGRFAESAEKAKRVIEQWAAGETPAGGRTRICISTDIFHRPPPGSTVEQMLERIWAANRQAGLGAPYLYGVTNRRIALLGRALESFGCCSEMTEFQNVSGSSFNPTADITLDPINLAAAGGCRELKGFVCETQHGVILVNNVVVMPSGRLAYCCACVGDFGDFLNDPEECLRRCLTDPVAMMLRRRETTISLLNIATELDPTIAVFGSGENASVAGSTCYQLLSGKRIESVHCNS